MTQTELKACPFCKNVVRAGPQVHTVFHPGHLAMGELIDCPLSNQVFPSRFWNTRTRGEVEGVREEVKRAIALIHTDEQQGGDYHRGMKILCEIAGIPVNDPATDLKTVDLRSLLPPQESGKEQ